MNDFEKKKKKINNMKINCEKKFEKYNFYNFFTENKELINHD